MWDNGVAEYSGVITNTMLCALPSGCTPVGGAFALGSTDPMGACSICGRVIRHKGNADRHARSHETAAARFWSHVDRRGPDECWPWTGSRSGDGYGSYSVVEQENGAHRYSYELNVGPIPDRLIIDHTCHSADPTCPGGRACNHRRCVNPAHLEPVTNRENVLRGRGITAGQARQTHCIHGHEFTPRNTGIGRGKRYCQACSRIRVAHRRGLPTPDVSYLLGAA